MTTTSLLSVVDYNKLVEVYHNDTDRAAAVLAAAFLDAYLAEFLRFHLVKDPLVEELFQNAGPLSSLYSRARCAYAMGLIQRSLLDDIELIRKVRNHFAHHPADTSFSAAPVRDICRSLSTAKGLLGLKEGPRHLHEPRFWYLVAVGGAVAFMHNTMLEAQNRG